MRPGSSSGLIIPERYGNESVPEVVSRSGYALLHFFSDAAYNLTGFNVSYRWELLPGSRRGGEASMQMQRVCFRGV